MLQVIEAMQFSYSTGTLTGDVTLPATYVRIRDLNHTGSTQSDCMGYRMIIFLDNPYHGIGIYVGYSPPYRAMYKHTVHRKGGEVIWAIQ